MIIGVQKCGTTTLAHWLAQHPEIKMCSQKEPEFFSKNTKWKNELEDYHALFKDGNGKLLMEASTSYSWLLEYPETPERLYEYNKDLKLIYIVREPIARIKSHYRHHVLKGYTKKPFSQEVFSNPTYLAHSSYDAQLRKFRHLFGDDQILCLQFEDLIKSEVSVLKKITSFLGIEDFQSKDEIDLTAQNTSSELKKVSPLKKYIAPLFRFVPLSFRLRARGVLYRNYDVSIDSNERIENNLYALLQNDIVAFKNSTAIDYTR